MDLQKLQLIRDDLLKYPIERKQPNNEFCGLYVDGTGNLTFDLANAAFHSFKAFSQFDYLIYLFVASSNDDSEIKKILNKYPNTKVYGIPPLKTPLIYNQWMFNYPWFFLGNHKGVLTMQDDGCLIQNGWEEFVTKGKYNFIGAPWRSEIQAIAKEYLKPLYGFNGGMSYRTPPEMIKCIKFVNDRGGQHEFFTGVKINGEVKQENSWLAEDLMFSSVGFTYNVFKEVSVDEAKKFSLEPIEFDLYMDKSNTERPFAYHKVDF